MKFKCQTLGAGCWLAGVSCAEGIVCSSQGTVFAEELTPNPEV